VSLSIVSIYFRITADFRHIRIRNNGYTFPSLHWCLITPQHTLKRTYISERGFYLCIETNSWAHLVPAEPNPNVFYCDEPGCNFSTANGPQGSKGLDQHKKHSHIGRICFWKTGDRTVCNFLADTDEAFREHFNGVHLSHEVPPGGQNPATWACRWPGFPGWINKDDPTGPLINEKVVCAKPFKTEQSSQRHAREHQRELWLEYTSQNRQLP